MTPAQIIDNTRVPGTQSVFFLGCFEKRVTVYSQQVRAINLVDAILDQNLLRAKGRVAIVGGGAAGLTAAVAFAKAVPSLQAIHVYERLSDVLQLQQNSNRFLHPHNYDWPAEGADNASAGLPLMNWRAGQARDVQSHLRAQFDAVEQTSRIELRVRTAVTGVTPFPLGSARIVTATGPVPEQYDVVILSIGFGLERSISGDTPSYWTISEMESPILAPGPSTIFISGNGDGGLVDFMSAALDSMSHQAICEMISGFDMPLVKAELGLIEQEAWAPGNTLDIYQAYRTRIVPLVPPAVWADLGERLRGNVKVRIHTNEAQLFKRETAVLNRLGCALLLEADRNVGHNALQVVVGVPFDGDIPIQGAITLAGEEPFVPYRRYLRLGPDSEVNLEPFTALLDLMPVTATKGLVGFMPATPKLSPTAQVRFAGFQAADVAGPAAVVNPDALPLKIGLAADGDLLVTCELPPADLRLAWRNQRQLAIECALSPEEAPRLLDLLARLGGHALACTFFARDRRQWEQRLRNAVRGRAMPGNVDIKFKVEELRSLDIPLDAQIFGASAFIDAAQTGLDAETLQALHDSLFDVLANPDPVECGWVIEVALRGQLWAMWKTWRAVLDADAEATRRFLLLLADEDDFVDPDEAALVRVGPKTLRSHLLKATLFALAFVLGADAALAPTPGRPGNLRRDGLSGHACGVAWIEGRDLGAKVAERNWTTGIVLLTELKVAAEFLFPEPRLDTLLGDLPRLGDEILADRPLILGADEEFLDALETGLTALSTYLNRIIDARATIAGAMIEASK